MRQRKGETDEAFQERRAAYDAGRSGRGSKWREVQRSFSATGDIVAIKERLRGRNPKRVAKIDQAVLARTSTLFDNEGRVSAQWVIERPEEKKRVEMWQAIARGMAADLPRERPMPAPVTSNASLMTCYPVGDHHMGMLAWKHETGASYDLNIGEGLLNSAFRYLTDVAPATPKATIIFLGDFFHYDSPDPKTPTNGNILDADGRFPKMVRAGVRSMRAAIKMALARHHSLHVIVEIGNHDLYTSVVMMECLDNVYEDEPRVTVDTSPKHFHYFRHGSTLVGVHHGHGPKPESLPLIMATDRPDDWGQTRFRYWYTGHVHSKRAWDFPGCSVESFRILPPVDAWAANRGYRSHRSMEAIVLHDTFGEVARYSVNPQMLEAA
jgi:hypothetical protein